MQIKKLNVKPVVLLTAFITWMLSASAQEIIDEDFLDNIETNAGPLWTENIPQFNTVSIPEKYSNSSAVVIGYRRSVNIDKKSRNGFLSKGERSLVFLENVRFKIKLNDRNSVKSFTEIYFRYSDKTDGFSARIIKPHGDKRTISLNDAVGVESVSEVPEFFKSFFDQQRESGNKYYKVAVPDLEPGDILEYVTITKSKLNVLWTGYIEFTPQYEVCNKSYPVLFNQIIIETDNKSYFKSLAVNGAPEFKKEPSADPEFFRYIFTDTDRGVEKDINFISPYEVYPMTKFQVIYANSDKVKGALIGNVGEIKSSFTKDELARKAWEDYEEVGNMYYPEVGTVQKLVNALWADMMANGAKNLSDKDFAKRAYYRLRGLVVGRDTYLSDKMAAYIFGSLLYQRDIKSELVITVARRTGSIDRTLFDQEIRYVIKVNNDYYYNCTDHSNPGDLVEDLLGREAYIIDKKDKKSDITIKKITLPDAAYTDNTENHVINAELGKDMNNLIVSIESTYSGINKNRNIGTALKLTPYMLEDYKNYNGWSPTARMTTAQQIEYFKAEKAVKEEFAEAKEKMVKEDLEKDYRQKVKYKGFEIKSSGRTQSEKELVYTESFELHNMIRKAGKKYLVNIPGLVGSQLQIKQEERERKFDINVGYGRSLSWVINFKMPYGYVAEGLKELNSKIENEAGIFSCTAVQEGGMIIIKINKVYKNAHSTKDKWPDMLAFVDAAYNNSFKYILLKPNN